MKYLIFITLLFSSQIYSDDKFYSVFNCENAAQTYRCDEGCFLAPVVKDIKINVEKDLIMVTSYFIGNISAPMLEPDILKNCSILDEKNWKCSDIYGYKKNITTTKDVSQNGIISSIVLMSETEDIYACYKKMDK